MPCISLVFIADNYGGKMGVKSLWSVLSHVREDCSLHDLAGKTLAVDLSGWICQAMTTKVKLVPGFEALSSGPDRDLVCLCY